ncbi:MAG: DUF4105 domain-containing protein [Planctomycetota bacterium]
MGIVVAAFLMVISLGAAVWAGGALCFDLVKLGPGSRVYVFSGWCLVCALLWFVLGPLAGTGVVVAMVAGVAFAWSRIEPKADSDWMPEFSQGATAEVLDEGGTDQVLVHDIRRGIWNQSGEAELVFVDRRYRPSDIVALDLLMSYWATPLLCHPIAIFDFGESVPQGERRLCWSVEARHVADGGTLSMVQSFYRAHELICMALDERDVLSRRLLSQQGTEVYLYRLQVEPLTARRLFLQYLDIANRLDEHPRWYNALTTNCLTAVYTQSDVGQLPFDWRLIVNGRLDQYLYDRELLDQSMPFDELRRRSRVNTLVDREEPLEAWGETIRAKLPGFGAPA